ncbi:hypothetical protein QTG54_008710 [Skeletonema marinoi]|uniref:Feruloyl esterase n=1 Tax=Skeletonema marinoi TaxID=267567 RepID=A0AAD8Y8T6_9STRA|nr:hypothetical protein QTG54_008710 [Skeletonema marinoi]
MVQSLKCSSFHTRTVTLPNCNEDDQQDCNRVYHLVLPRILCHSGVRRLGEAPEENEYFDGTHKRVGTLPLVFALHAFEEDARSMEVFIPYADASNFVLVLPEGKEFSFNAGDCCGAAKHDDINDVEYLAHLKQELTQEFSFLHPSLTYGIGWNNGAFMLTYAMQQVPSMFKAIVPIAGYTHRLQEMVNADAGMMLHYSLDDTQTRPSGCCDNPNLPECNGEVMSDWCVSILQFFDLWATEVDQCSISDASGGFDNHIVSNNNGLEYSFSYRDNTTVFELKPDTNNPEKVDKLFQSKLPMSTTYHDEEKGVTCLTVTSSSCVSNSTLCLYTKQGDFRPNFAKSFFMYDEVMNYIATDACKMNDGQMVSASSKRACACEITSDKDEVEYGGTFCFDALNEDGTFKPREIAPVVQPLSTAERHQTLSHVFVGMFAAMFAAVVLAIGRLKKRRVVTRKKVERQIYDHCDQYSPNYRDFGRKDTEKVSNVKKKKHDDDTLTNDSEHSEHASPFRYRDQIHDTSNHHLDTSEWDEHQSPYLFNIIKAAEMAEVKQHSGREREDSLESLDSYLEEHQPPWEACQQEKIPVEERKKSKGSKKGSKKNLPTSLMHVINAPAAYLDSADRRLLRRYRQQQKDDDVNMAIIGGVKNALIRKNSEQGRGSPSIETSVDASLARGEASLSNDLEQIEASMGTMT